MKRKLDLFEYNDNDGVGRLRTTTPSQEIAIAEKLEANMMTKAQFNALAEERKANRAGSGFDEWGKHRSGHPNINEGMWLSSTLTANAMFMGRISTDGGIGVSKSDNPIINSNGTLLKIINVDNSSTFNTIALPTAPNIYPYDTVLTTEQINSGVIKHADASNSGLITNGKFDTDASGWTALWNCTLSNENGRLKATSTVESGYMDYNQAFTTIVGKKYVVECLMDNGNSYDIQAYIRTGTGYGTIISISPSKTFEFTATSTTTNIAFRSYVTSLGQYSYVDNIAVYPADAISRSDLVFLESWHEDVSEKNFVYDNGNTQSLSTANTIGVTPTNGNFTGFETYSLFGNWMTPSSLIGKGYVWSTLTEVQKRAFIANPENNCYLDGNKVIQARYRVRVVQGLGDNTNSFSTLNTASYLALFEFGVNSIGLINAKGKKASTPDTKPYADRNTTGTYYNLSSSFGESIIISSGTPSDIAYEGKCFALPIALISRRNQGMYHPVYNPNGTKKASDGNFWYNTAVSFASISDCFDPAKLLAASGYIGSVSGRPDGLFYDQVHEGDILDLRNSSKKVEDYNRLISREFNKLVAGTTRGKEREPFTESKLQTTTGTVATVEVNDGTAYESGSVVQIFDLTAGSVKGRFIVKSVSGNTLTVDSSFAKSANIYVIGGGKR